MAGDWIKMRSELPRDPAVIYTAKQCGIDTDSVCGKLLRLWSWAENNTEDGVILNVDFDFINQFMGAKKFAESLEKSQWLEKVDGGIKFPNFDRHNTKCAKRRARDADRKRTERGQNADDSAGQSGRTSTMSSGQNVLQHRTGQNSLSPSGERTETPFDWIAPPKPNIPRFMRHFGCSDRFAMECAAILIPLTAFGECALAYIVEAKRREIKNPDGWWKTNLARWRDRAISSGKVAPDDLYSARPDQRPEDVHELNGEAKNAK